MAWLQRLTIREHPTSSTKDLIQDQMLVEFDSVLRSTRNYLGELNKAIAEYNRRSEEHTKSNIGWGESISKAKVKGLSGETGFEESLGQGSKVQTQLPTLETEMIQAINSRIYTPLLTFINEDMEARKPLQKKYEKARNEYDALVTKSKQLSSSKKVDAVKLYTVEREKDKAKKIMDTYRTEYEEYMEELQMRISTDVLEMMIHFYEAYKTEHTAGYSQLTDIKDYIDNLATWCGQEKEYFKDMVTRRENEWTITKQNEEYAKISPFLDFILKPPLTILRCLRDAEREVGPLGASNLDTIKSFVSILDGLHKAAPLFSTLIASELPSILGGGLLFGTSNATLEVLLECVRFYAGDYLKTMIQPTVTNISTEAKNYQYSTEEGVGNLVNEIYNIFTAIVQAPGALPSFFKRVCEKIAESNSADATSALIAAFIVGRVLPPALQDPHRFGLLKDPPTESVRSSLHFIVQFLHIFSANKEFPTNHAQAIYLNEAISVWRSPTSEFYNELAAANSSGSANGSSSNGGGSNGGLTSSQNSSCGEEDLDFQSIETDISNVWGKLKDHYQAICVQLSTINEADVLTLTQLLTAFEPDPTP